ncbi:isopentenyl-diphosphate Delta-isomerase I isoform X1 [Zea mays]|uniref:Isopentenyl-diphosphate Delta-isomerase n=1 Tax=Zea mays TaxID=4577 RepID=A0A804UGF2_MAIZE|nr:uncharacterized protein LOC100502421 isoform X1 [Zea mays]|eukprot:XP_008655399.1 uncharacterized protein LOC100502421 isoform X1 [Zea mays]
MAASASRPLALLACTSASLGAGRRAWARLAVSSYSARSALPRLRGRRSFATSARGAVMGNPGPGAVDADVGMDAVQRRLMFEDECILVDEQDNVIGHESKYNCHLMEKIEAGNVLHRAFSVFLFNSKYELLLQQRSATKVTFPLVWTNTCCSHPLYRESELIEENCAVDYLLFMVRDVKLNPNPEEVADVKYVNRDQLKELLRKADAGEDGVKMSPWFRLVVDNFLMGWWDHVEQGTLQGAADMKTIHKL